MREEKEALNNIHGKNTAGTTAESSLTFFLSTVTVFTFFVLFHGWLVRERKAPVSADTKRPHFFSSFTELLLSALAGEISRSLSLSTIIYKINN